MKEGTYPQDECLSTVSNPKAESLCKDALGAVALPVPALGQRRLRLPPARAAGTGWWGQRVEGEREASASAFTRCLWGPSCQMQSGFRSSLAD